MTHLNAFLTCCLAGMLSACQPSKQSESNTSEQPTASAASATTQTQAEAMSANRIEMRIDGKPWAANAEIFGAIDPLGLTDAILISGSFGPNDASEQDFSMTLTGASKPGRYRIQNAKPVGSVVQIGNLSQEKYLIGGLMFEHDIEVELLQRQVAPLRIEGRFSGWLQANDGSKVQIRDGAFSYQE